MEILESFENRNAYITQCDNCGKKQYQDLLMNFYPEVNYTDELLKEEYKSTDGMICIECYIKEMTKRTKEVEEFIEENGIGLILAYNVASHRYLSMLPHEREEYVETEEFYYIKGPTDITKEKFLSGKI